MIEKRIPPFATTFGLIFTLACTACTTPVQDGRDFAFTLSAPVKADPQDSGQDTQALAHWWRSFNDPVLTGLIEQGQANNADIARAQRDYRQALADIGDGSDKGGLSALFGKGARGDEAGKARLSAMQYRKGDAEARIAAEIALAYIAVREQQLVHNSVKSRLESQQDNREVAAYRREAGLARAYDEDLARVQHAQTWTTLGQIEAELQERIITLAQLVGITPDELADRIGAQGLIPYGDTLLGNDEADYLPWRRADLREAERTLSAELIDAGIGRDQVEAALAAQKAGSAAQFPAELADALKTYQGAVQKARNEVEHSRQILQSAIAQADALTDARQSAEAAIKDAKLAYNNGYGDFARIYVAEDALGSVQRSLAHAEAQRAAAMVNFYTALGGGWDSPAPAQPSVTPPATPTADTMTKGASSDD
ncbi:TolC family protein [Altericroceibacterium spongiae]|uniref:TolC family protein n=1 Tax=Altericroceibacterium spongiae TaxID=2320269 RepID=UPI0011C4214A|nr:TolC family protein [Altericroceibacterium spongiae]